MPSSKKKVLAQESKPQPKKAPNPLFPSKPKSFRIGGAIRPKGTDLSRFVRWPKYVRLQRQRAILYQRLKVPPAVNQFTCTLKKNEAATVFTLLNKYRPETSAAKRQRIKEKAAAAAAGQDVDMQEEEEDDDKDEDEDKNRVVYGLKHVTYLLEEKKVSLICIACDVDPVELVLWLPALCRKMDVPYVIVKDKARLGALVHHKTATCVGLTGVNAADEAQLALLQTMARDKYNDNAELLRKWGGGIMGLKTLAKLDKRAKAVAAEEAKKAAASGRM